MLGLYCFFYGAFAHFETEEKLFSSIMDLVKWGEGGLPIRDLQKMPIDMILSISAEASLINQRIKASREK